MRIFWREEAQSDLRQAIQYLRQISPRLALNTSQKIRQRVRLLADHPHLGRAGRVEGTRELVIAGTSYIVAYTVDGPIDAVIILRVLHGRRLWPEQFDDEGEQE